VTADVTRALDQPWRRLDLRMLLVHPVNEVIRFFPALLAAYVIGSSSGDGGWWHYAAVGVPVLIGIGRFLTTRFRITGTQLELRRGLLSRSVLTAPLDRVRTVELTSSPIHRLLGLAKVQIGTGSAARSGNEKVVLDSLPVAEARTLRSALIHNVGHAVESDTTVDDVLLRLDPAWVRYAPLTTSGVVIAAAGLGAASQFIEPAINRLESSSLSVPSVPLWATIVAATVVFVVVSSVLAIAGYVVANWGFTVARDRDGRSFHTARGLLTTRETSLDSERVRGLEIHEPLGLRVAGAASATAIATGLRRADRNSGAIVPPAPRTVVEGVGGLVLGDATPLTAPLVAHGPAARRRRFTRALTGAALVAAAVVALLESLGAPHALDLLAAVPLAVASPLAADRYRRLGHALVGHWFVTRRDSFRGRRDVLDTDGIIGWSLGQSYFQRRAGLTNLTATTSAGKQAYGVYDVPEDAALALVRAADPDLIEPFLTAPVRSAS
jgi:putative membrane protein